MNPFYLKIIENNNSTFEKIQKEIETVLNSMMFNGTYELANALSEKGIYAACDDIYEISVCLSNDKDKKKYGKEGLSLKFSNVSFHISFTKKTAAISALTCVTDDFVYIFNAKEITGFKLKKMNKTTLLYQFIHFHYKDNLKRQIDENLEDPELVNISKASEKYPKEFENMIFNNQPLSQEFKDIVLIDLDINLSNLKKNYVFDINEIDFSAKSKKKFKLN